MSILITGAAGFIGFHLAKKLLESGAKVIGIDNFNDYYAVKFKEERNKLLKKNKAYKMYRGELVNRNFIKKVLKTNKIDKIVNLAAQAGVRHSLDPYVYFQSNVVGFLNLIHEAKESSITDFIYASSSSVYGDAVNRPSNVSDATDRPMSIYAATKKIDELIAYNYHYLYGLNCTGLRLFTVYGPYGRPDMAYFSFTDSILKDEAIKVFGSGKMKRDFTYIDDIISGLVSAIYHSYPYEIFNLGNGRPIEINTFIGVLENALGRRAKKLYLSRPKVDVIETYANLKHSKDKLGFAPTIKVEEGLRRFVEWYKQRY